jgi:hypothetical protein
LIKAVILVQQEQYPEQASLQQGQRAYK